MEKGDTVSCAKQLASGVIAGYTGTLVRLGKNISRVRVDGVEITVYTTTLRPGDTPSVIDEAMRARRQS